MFDKIFVNRTWSVFSIAALFAVFFLAFPDLVSAAVTVTPATGGSAISADTAGGTYTALTGPTATEGASRDIPASGTFILNAPAGFAFNTSSTVTATITRLAGTGSCFAFSSSTATPTASIVTFTVSSRDNNGTRCEVTFSGLQVRPTAGTPLASGNLTNFGTNSGFPSGATNYGALTGVVGAKSKLAFTTQPSSTAAINTDFTTKPVVKVQDQFGNVVTSDNSSTIAIAPVMSDQACDGTAGSGSLSSTPASGSSVSAGVLSYTAMQYSKGEAIKICASSSGLTSALSTTVSLSPTITGVTASEADGYYRAGQTIHVQVVFSSPVTVSGTPQLTLSTGSPATTVVNYSSGSGTDTLVFDYTIASGNSSSDLDYASTSALALNSGTIKDTATGNTNAALTLTSPSAAGSLSANKGIVIDAVAPVAPSVPDLDSADDSGASDSDNITKQNSNLTFSGTAEANSTVEFFDSALSKGTTVAAGGNYSFTTSLASGVHSITLTATDAAGNVSAASGALSVTVDTSAPAIPSVPDLAAADDTGSSDSDNLTKNTANLTLSGTGETDSIVEIFDAAVSKGTATVAAGSWTLDISLAAGVHSLTTKATDIAGNVSSASGALSVTVDTSAPATPSVPSLAPTDDTGLSDSDDITKNTTGLTFFGTGENDSVVELLDGAVSKGTATVSSGNYVFDISLAAGVHSLTAVATDTSGNASAASGALSVTVDTSAPATPPTPDLDAADDSGASDSDNITKNMTDLTFSGTAEAGATVDLLDGVVSKGTMIATGGNYSFIVSLLAGVHSITLTATDVAGNKSDASSSLSLTIDISSPDEPSVPDLAAADDDGVSDSDNITTQTAGLTFSGTAEAASTVELFVGAVSQGTTTATGGNWSFDIALSVGNYTVKAIATDVAGNVSASSDGLSVTIDSPGFGTPSIPDLDAADDSGSSDSDNVTKNTSGLTFFGVAEVDSTIELFDGAVSKGTTTATGGNWTLGISLAAGTHSLTIYSTDGVSSATSDALSVTVDTSAPDAPSIPDFAAADDTGISDSDNITKQSSNLTFSGTAEAGSTVGFYRDDIFRGTVPATGGNWIIEGATPAGVHYYYAEATDLAGNISGHSGSVTVTIDLTPPDGSSIPDLAAADDSGLSDSDNITKNTSGLTFFGTAEADSEIELFEDSVSIGTTTATAGSWSVDVLLAAGMRYISAIVTDVAGNTSASSISLAVKIDTVAPDAPDHLNFATADDTGSSNSDHITKNASGLTFSGVAEADSMVEVFAGAVSKGTATSVAGDWTLDISLTDGAYSITAVATDLAGNQSAASAAVSITVDTLAPDAPSAADLDNADDTGISNTDNITSQTANLTGHGTAEAGSIIDMFLDGTSRGTIPNVGGNWTFEGSVPAGVHALYVTATDAAGNVSAPSETFTLTIDTSTPTLAQTAPVSSPTNDTTLNYSFSSSEAGALSYSGSAGCGSASSAASAGANTITFNTLSPGSYSCWIRVTDTAGNASSFLYTNTFRIDTSAPSLTEVTPVPSSTNDTTPSYTFSSNEDGTITYGGTSGCTSATTSAVDGENTITFSTLSQGTYSCTIRVSDAAGNQSAFLSLSAFTVDTAAPTISGVSSSIADGTYNISYTIPITVGFSETIVVGGTPRLSLSTGSPAVTAVDYVSGSGSDTMTFNYTIAAGNLSSDLDYSGTGALDLNGGTIKDAAGNDAILTLASPNAAGSLAANNNIVVDANALVISITAPTKVSTAAITDTDIYITDSDGVLASTVTAAASTLKFSDLICVQTDANTVDCSISIDGSGNLTISATDVLGNPASTAEPGYTINPAVVWSAAPSLPARVGDGQSDFVVPAGTVREISLITRGGANIQLYPNSELHFPALASHSRTVDGHQIKIVDLDLFNNILTLQVESTPQIIKLALGESRVIDLD